MTDWPPTDRAGVYELPRQVQEPPSTETQVAHLAVLRISQGLPVSDEVLDEVTELQKTIDGIETRSEHVQLERSRGLIEEVRAALTDADAGLLLGAVERCWINGCSGVRVRLTGELEKYRGLLEEQFGRHRIRVDQTALAEVDISALQTRLGREGEDLAQHGISLSRSGAGRDGFELAFYAWDQPAAERLLRDRYGTDLILDYRGASRHTFRAFPFASWLAEGDLLHVFYALAHNGEQPGRCLAYEAEDSVVVALSIKDWRGPKTLVGGFTPSHASVQLERPLLDRVVIDDSANRVRPHWTDAPVLRPG